MTPAGFGCCRERFGGGLVPSTSGGRLKSIRRCTPRASRRTAVMSSIAITSIFGSDPQSLVRSGMAKFLKVCWICVPICVQAAFLLICVMTV